MGKARPRKSGKKKSQRSALFTRLRKHFGTDPAKLPVVEQNFPAYDRANLHLTVEELLADSEPRPELVGVVLPHQYSGVSLAKLTRPSTAKGYEEGPVEYVDVQLADEQRLACVKQGLYTFRQEGAPLALLLVEEETYRTEKGVQVAVMAPTR